ncbi:MAG: deoxyribonuclease IV [Dehalococcoidia bacterium]|nr:deoxyribonuclease IV [Dehalococcoidia bacterium]
MRVGLHLSIGKGLKKTAQTALATGCQALQIFSGNPMGWKPSSPDAEDVAGFRQLLDKNDIAPVFLHAPYLVNPAAPNPEIWGKSAQTLVRALALAEELGASYVVTHLGSHVGTGMEAGVDRLVEAVTGILGVAPGPMLLLENSPGSRNELGSYFEEFGDILKRLAPVRSRLGVCLDTAHLWGAGYDLSTPSAVQRTLAEFDRLVGFDRLHGIHANDSTLERGAHRDLHTIPGEGKIGIDGFCALVRTPELAGMSYILELPRTSDEECIPVLARFRSMAL